MQRQADLEIGDVDKVASVPTEPVEIKIISSEEQDRIAAATQASQEKLHPVQDIVRLLLEKSVLDALEKKYGPPDSLFKAGYSALCENDKFSWREVIIILVSLMLGGLASFFMVSSAGKAPYLLEKLIKDTTGFEIPAIKVIKFIMQISAVGEFATLSTSTTNKMIHYYFDQPSAEEEFLKKNHATTFEIVTTVFLKVLYLVSAVTANIPVYFIANVIWELALASTGANTGITWSGISDLINSAKSVHPARRVELEILHEELEKFIKLPEQEQQAILDEIQALHEEKDISNDIKFKRIFLRLLTLSRHTEEVLSKPEPPEKKQTSYFKTAINIGTGMLCASAELFSFAAQSGISINALFKNKRKQVGPIILGTLTTASAGFPCAGFGLRAGMGQAEYYTSGNVPVASLSHSTFRNIIRWTVRPFSAFAAGSFYDLVYTTATNIISVANIQPKPATALKFILPAVCYIGGCTEMDFYTLSAIDDVLNHFNQHCSDPTKRRLLSTIFALKKSYAILAEANAENYFKYLNYKLEPDSELATFLMRALELRLSNQEKHRVNADLRKYANAGQTAQISVPDEVLEKTPGFCYGTWCRLFGKNIQPKSDIESGLEMQNRTSFAS